MDPVEWSEGTWWNPPPQAESEGPALRVSTALESDLWRHTNYGFVHDTGHGLLAPLADGEAMECDVEADYAEQFDQAGMVMFADQDTWIKCGIEWADGSPQLGAVVTAGKSDWSAHPVAGWEHGVTTFRLSRFGDSVTIRAKRLDRPWQLVRLAPIDPTKLWSAGPYAASPSRAGLEVRFIQWRRGPADDSLH